ncbi:MAG: class I SAM-dependent methyltransferase [Methanobacteriaceae archaeon]|nr:class I SAM-dependent methyltransferase [Methanobacteriaceae archaeon]
MDLFNLPPDSEKVFNELNNYGYNFKIFNIIKTSLEMRIYDFLEQDITLNDLSDKVGIQCIKLEILLNVLIKLGYIQKNNDNYKNSEIGDIYLRSNSPYSIMDYFFTMCRHLDMWYNLEDTLKGNITLQDKEVFVNVVNGMGFECLFGELKRTTDIINNYSEFKNAKTSLDIGGGHGLYSIAMSKLNPNLQSYVFDLKTVVKETQKFIERYDSTVKTISGDFNTDDFKGSYDIIFSSYNPGGKNPKIAKKAIRSLNNGGLYITKQCFNNESSNVNQENTLEDYLGMLEWNFANLNEGDFKNKNMYSFKGDLNYNDYLAYLEKEGLSILDTYCENSFSNPYSKKCNAKMIIAKKM